MVNRSFLPHYFGLPVIDSLDSLADEMRITKNFLSQLVVRADFFYREFTIPKKSGGARLIAAPSPKMKAVQGWILRRIIDRIAVSEFATAFRIGMKLSQNLEPHVGNTAVLCMDLEDFFGTIKWDKVYTIFSTLGYPAQISRAFANLCTYKGALPQGGVASPSLSNIVCIRLDRRISGYTSRRNIAYTRYADDMTFSSTNPARLIGLAKFVRRIISEEGFSINDKKTRFMGPAARRVVTGLVLSKESYGIGRRRERALRARIHRFLKSDPNEPEHKVELSRLAGWFAYLKDIDPQRCSRLKQYTFSTARRLGVVSVPIVNEPIVDSEDN